MRNGLNTSGLSEFVHEIEQNPEEGVLEFTVVGSPGADEADTRVLTTRFGMTRMARDFTITHHPLRSRGRSATPYESALAAFGACVLMTHVQGYTVRGVSITDLRVRVSAELLVDDSDGSVFRDIRYRIDVDCDCGDEVLGSVTQFVSALSPNHRLLVDDADFDVVVTTRRPSGESETFTLNRDADSQNSSPGANQRVLLVTAELRWEYGMETWASTSTGDAGWHTIVLDQGKQMLGIDRGPNPQEVLLSAICSDLALGIRDRIPAADVRIRSQGRLDARGAHNVEDNIPVRFHGGVRRF